MTDTERSNVELDHGLPDALRDAAPDEPGEVWVPGSIVRATIELAEGLGAKLPDDDGGPETKQLRFVYAIGYLSGTAKDARR